MLQVCKWQARHSWGALLWARGKVSPMKPLPNLLGVDQSPLQPGLSALGEASPCSVLPQKAWPPTAPASQPTSPPPHWGCGGGDAGGAAMHPTPCAAFTQSSLAPGGGPGGHGWQQGPWVEGQKVPWRVGDAPTEVCLHFTTSLAMIIPALMRSS